MSVPVLERQLMEAPNDLSELIGKAAEVTRRAGLSEASARLQAAGDRLRSQCVYVAILGQCKRGKSTLVNALMGESVLPSSIVPLTAVPTVIRHGEVRSVKVRFLDDRPPVAVEAPTADALLHCVSDYVTERANPENVLNVAQVEVLHPALILGTGLVLVDTPGIGSTLQHNTQATLNFLPECDAAVFVLSPDPPLTEVEREFLDTVRRRVSRLFYVLTKADYVDDREREELLEFVTRELESEGAESIDVLTVSAKLALVAAHDGSQDLLATSGITAVESALTGFAAHEMAAVLATQVGQRLTQCLREATDRLVLERRLLMMPLDDLEQRSVQFRRELDAAVAERRMAHDLIAGDKRRLQEALETDAGELRRAAREHLRGLLSGNRAGDFETVLAEHIPPYFEKALGEISLAMSERLEAAIRLHQGRADAVIANVSELASDVLSIEYVAPAAVDAFKAKREPYWVTHEWQVSPRTVEPAVAERLLPKRLHERAKGRRLEEVLDRLVINNVENVRWAILQNINDWLTRYAGDLDRRLAQTAEDIERAINEASDRKYGGVEAVEERCIQVDAWTREVRSLLDEADAMASIGAAVKA